MENTMYEITKKMCEEIQAKKDALFLEAFRKKTGLHFDLEAEKRRRFKNILLTQQNNEETIWYNNGTETGLRIITFVYPQPKLKHPIEDNLNVNFEFLHY